MCQIYNIFLQSPVCGKITTHHMMNILFYLVFDCLPTAFGSAHLDGGCHGAIELCTLFKLCE